MTQQVYGDIVTKKLTDDNGSVYWLLFRSGEVAHPIIVLTDAAARALAEIVTTAEKPNDDDIPF